MLLLANSLPLDERWLSNKELWRARVLVGCGSPRVALPKAFAAGSIRVVADGRDPVRPSRRRVGDLGVAGHAAAGVGHLCRGALRPRGSRACRPRPHAAGADRRAQLPYPRKNTYAGCTRR